jgi:hypothetical protein
MAQLRPRGVAAVSALLPLGAASYGGRRRRGALVTAVTKLYMAPLKDDLPLVLNLSGPPKHPSFECHQYHHVCAHAHS